MPGRTVGLKLGRLPKRTDARTLRLRNYISHEVPLIPPPVINWQAGISGWGMMANDTTGDCTIAAAGHMEMLWSKYTGTEWFPTDNQILNDYSSITGYDRQTGANDNGAVELDVLNYWRTKGIAGQPIEGYASIEPPDATLVKQAVYLFGGVYIGFEVPQSALNQYDAGQEWDLVANDGGIAGGHAVPVFGYDLEGCTVVTWGTVQRMSWNFWNKYVDEAYAILSPQWFNTLGNTPVGYTITLLRQDLGMIAGGVINASDTVTVI